MAYNQTLAQRIREILTGTPDLVEKKMFGGVGFLVQGNMACGVNGDDLIVRVGVDRHLDALNQPHAKPFDLTGRPMSGWVLIAAEGLTTETDLKSWVVQGVEFARTLPAKH